MKKLDFSLFTDLESKAEAEKKNDPVVLSSEYKLLLTKNQYRITSAASAAALEDTIREGEGIPDAKVVYIDDILEDPALYDQLGEIISEIHPEDWTKEYGYHRPHIGIKVKNPGDLSRSGTTEYYWYQYGRYRAYYIQIDWLSHELVHTFKGQHPFRADYNYYIKSWNNPHVYLIQGTVQETYTRPVDDEEINFNSIKLKKTSNATPEDVKYLHINGELNWLEFEGNYYYINKTLYFNGEECKIKSLDKNYNIVAENLLENELNFNLSDDKALISILTPNNSTPYKIGETIFVNNSQAIITGIIESDIIFNTYLGVTGREIFSSPIFSKNPVDTSEFQEGTPVLYNEKKYLVRTKSNTGLLLEAEEDGELIFIKNNEFNTIESQDYKEGDIVYFNGEEYTISSILDGVAILTAEGKESLTINIASNDSLSKTSNNTGALVGNTVYINGEEEVVKTIAGVSLTTEQGTTVEDVNTDDRFSLEPNTTGLAIGDKVFINGVEETVKTISGSGFTTEEDTVVTNTEEDTRVSDVENTTGLVVGDFIYIDGVRETVATVSGSGFTTEEGTIVENTQTDPRVSTEENTTGFVIGEIVYYDGQEMKVVNIRGDDIVLEQIILLEESISAGDDELLLSTSVQEGDQLILDEGLIEEETIEVKEVIE